mmetsp:Transcript_11551/g.11633  ORF Transcript_11551/g.11633 Transcript_11551/m.11633 type:complete len:82 (+) Transcript_11551:496-741(+)
MCVRGTTKPTTTRCILKRTRNLCVRQVRCVIKRDEMLMTRGDDGAFCKRIYFNEKRKRACLTKENIGGNQLKGGILPRDRY